MFTASLLPSNAAAALAALRQIEQRPEFRARLWQNASLLYDGLSALGFSLCAPLGPIIAVRMFDRAAAAYSWNRLLEDGVYVNLAIPPGTPDGSSLLRLSMSAAHTEEEIAKICEAFARLADDQRPAEATGR